MKLQYENREETGLCEEEVARSRSLHGKNVLTRKKGKSFLRRFLSNLNDPVIRILLGALLVHLVLVFRDGDWAETVGIGIAVFLATFISTLSEHGSEKAFSRLARECRETKVRVRRRGIVQQIPQEDVVVGDILLLSPGEGIPADGRLLTGEVSVDQSAMTGESREVKKRPSEDPSQTPYSPSHLFRGCTVTEGMGEMRVCAVGDATFLGEISSEIQEDTRQTPLKRRLSVLARQISILGYVAALLVAGVYLFNVFFLDSGMRHELILLKLRDVHYLLSHLFHAFTLALTVIVVAVPEGLPMMIAVVLSANVKRMVRDRVLVRKPVGIESAGSMDLLFTDKTGTLTLGKMQVGELLLPNGNVRTLPALFREGGRAAEWIRLSFFFGNGCSIGKDDAGRRVAIGGNATARALFESLLPYPLPAERRVLSQLPFDSARKFSAVTLGGKERVTLLLGAPEVLFPHVRESFLGDGALPFQRRSIEKSIAEHMQKGERVLAIAACSDAVSASALANGFAEPLLYLGAVTLSDPLRPDAKDSVMRLHEAGIRVVMITGDGKETALSVARGCGILQGEQTLSLGAEELATMSDTRVREMLPRLAVVFRALPTDKSRLVRIAQEANRVVGMTGDGINDAPALRRADVGFAMGSGTQVAKDAGEIIILDNDLASIVRAVLYGRSIFKSIRKFITLQLTMNFCAVGVSMIAPFLGIDAPVTVVQMLWINMIMDTLGGLAFAGEAPLPEYMREPPKQRDTPILNRYMIHRILFCGGFTLFLFLFFLKSPTVITLFRTAPGGIYHLTAFFALFIFSSVFNCFNARTDRLNLCAGLRKNPVFLLIMGAILIIQILFIYLGGAILRTVPLLACELIPTMLLALSVFPAELLRKALLRLFGKNGGY